MLTYKYTARDPATGKKISSEVQADSVSAAAKLLRQQGLAPLDIAVGKQGPFGFISNRKGRVKTKDKVIFSRQLATLINAGLPLVQSLRNVGEQTQNNTFKIVISEVISAIEGGSAFSEALSKHPRVFNEVYVSLIAAAETSGTLDKGLERLANQQEKDAELISKIRGAMAYPGIVVLVMVGVVGFMVVKVLPAVEDIYKGLPGISLPLVTRILLAVSHFTTHFWWALLLLLVVLIFFGTRWARTLGGKEFIDGFKMRAPLIGPLFMKMYMARFARTGTTLIGSGVPLLQMLEITANAVNNVHIAGAIHKAMDKVKGGTALSEALSNNSNFLALVPNMLKVGEQSGALEDMMAKIADYYEKEVDGQIKTISTIIEPVLMVVLGLVAFTVVAAVLLPIYSLAGQNFIR